MIINGNFYEVRLIFYHVELVLRNYPYLSMYSSKIYLYDETYNKAFNYHSCSLSNKL